MKLLLRRTLVQFVFMAAEKKLLLMDLRHKKPLQITGHHSCASWVAADLFCAQLVNFSPITVFES
jgi:hypothetical protein